MRSLFHAAAFLAFAIPGTASAAVATNTEIILDKDFLAFLERFREGTERFLNGDTGLWKDNVSQSADTMIMGAWGAYEKGWPEVSKRYDWAGARFVNSGAVLNVEYLASAVSGDLAYTVAIERSTVKLAGQDTATPMALRATHVFRRENGEWKLMLRHADSLMNKTAPDAVLFKGTP
jgi:ketosteroid isomerase-like protein